MERLTPEFIVKKTEESTLEAGKVVIPPLARVGKAALPAGLWALDEIVGSIPVVRHARSVTRRWRAATWYTKEGQHGK